MSSQVIVPGYLKGRRQSPKRTLTCTPTARLPPNSRQRNHIFDNYLEESTAGDFSHVVSNNTTQPPTTTPISQPAPLTKNPAIFNQAAFTCPSGAAAADRAAHGVPTWQSCYFGD
jgi:hypothetical protein